MTLPAPILSHAFDIRAEIDTPLRSGPGPMGERLHIPITGGTVEGPMLTGRVLPGGSDWPLIGPDGHSRIDAHYTIQATDGTLIYVHNVGLRVSTPEALARVQAGEAVEAPDFYMRAAPTFDAPDGPHRWLSQRLFISTLRPSGRTITVSVYLVG